MSETAGNADESRRSRGLHYWVRRFFVLWAIVSTVWFVGRFRTRNVPPETLADDARVVVQRTNEALAFLPVGTPAAAGLVFIVGGGVAAEAYAPLLRPIAEQGYPVHIVRLPYRLAPLERHKKAAVQRAQRIIRSDGAAHWVVAGHSLGGALAARVARQSPSRLRGMVLLGTSHPKAVDMSGITLEVTKVFASNDGIATPEMIAATRELLPADTRWVEIVGGNHSQFGHYGHQLFDGTPTISRQRQQEIARGALLDALQSAVSSPRGPD